MTSVVIYGKQTCNPCHEAKAHLEKLQIEYVFHDIANQANRAEMLQRNPDAKTVPQIFIGNKLVGGRDDLLAIPIVQLQQMIGGK